MAQNLTYTRCGDYLIPDIQLSHTSDKTLGKYGRMRRAFLAENSPILLLRFQHLATLKHILIPILFHESYLQLHKELKL